MTVTPPPALPADAPSDPDPRSSRSASDLQEHPRSSPLRRGALLLGEIALVAGALTAFLLLATHQLHLPGLYYDEAADAVPAMQIVLGQPVDLSRGAGIELFGRVWPLMVMEYVGAVSTYAIVPMILWLGVTPEAVRAAPIAGGAVTLLLSWGLLRAAFGRTVAVIAVWLVALHPSFVFWTRQGVHVSSLMTVCSVAATWLGLGWWRGGGSWRLIPAAFLLGLGVSIKLLFVWYVVALALVAFVLRPPLLSRQPLLRWRDLPAATLAIPAFLIGAGFIILYNIQTQGTIEVLVQNAVTTSYGVDNRAFLQNLLTRLDAFLVYLRSEHFWYFGQQFLNPAYPTLFVAALGALLGAMLVDPAARRRWRQAAFLLLMIGAILVQSTVTVSGLGPTHFYLLYPLPQAVLALAAVWTVRAGARWGRPAAVGAAVLTTGALAVLIAFDLAADRDYHSILARTGGVATHSDSIYDLTEYLLEWKGHKPVAMDWGIAKSVQYLSKGEVNPPELFGYTGASPPPNWEEWLLPHLEDPWTLYIFHDERFTVFPRWQQFAAFAEAHNRKIRPELYIQQHDQRIIFVLFTLRPR
ncbi:MAG: glycosyltransferase family 39 protein [Chloroflexota bacterium]|nr:glycosyltransferase family 39 protein [Dehalococcoidia bacterium]MDW8254159.1 glycosyltransferase family 39 protein [Chloroflexota bacterium]